MKALLAPIETASFFVFALGKARENRKDIVESGTYLYRKQEFIATEIST